MILNTKLERLQEYVLLIVLLSGALSGQVCWYEWAQPVAKKQGVHFIGRHSGIHGWLSMCLFEN